MSENKPNWIAYFIFLFLWITFGAVMTFGSILMHGVEKYATTTAIVLSWLLWLLLPVTFGFSLVANNKTADYYAGKHFLAWILITLWVLLSPSIRTGHL